jgi:hypothetical protein
MALEVATMSKKKVPDALEFRRWKREEQQKVDFEAYLKERLKTSRQRRSLKAMAGSGIVDMTLSELRRSRRKVR